MILTQNSNYDLDVGAFMQSIFHTGTNYITEGLRGGGKTFQAMCYAWGLVNGVWPAVGKVILLTNVIFIKRVNKTEGDPKTDFVDNETPENVHHITTLESLFRTLSELMNKHPKRDVLYLIILDEAQNFFHSLEAHSEMSVALQKWFGIVRKFDACLWMMTPSIKNVPPKGRCFNDDPKYPGYLNGIWAKNRTAVSRFMKANDITGNPKQWTMLRISYEDKPRFLKVPSCPWTKNYRDLRVGEYCYDGMSSADFTMGDEKFKLSDLIAKCSDVSSLRMPDALKLYFKDLDDETLSENDKANLELARNKFLRMVEMRRQNITWKNLAKIEGVDQAAAHRGFDRLCQRFASEYLTEDELDALKKGRTKSGKIRGTKLQNNDISETLLHNMDDDELSLHDNEENATMVQNDAESINEKKDASVSLLPSDSNGISEACIPLSVGSVEGERELRAPREGSDDPPEGSSAIPDGKYDLDEFRRAADHCLPHDDEEDDNE